MPLVYIKNLEYNSFLFIYKFVSFICMWYLYNWARMQNITIRDK
jgi:hypothetical protein